MPTNVFGSAQVDRSPSQVNRLALFLSLPLKIFLARSSNSDAHLPALRILHNTHQHDSTFLQKLYCDFAWQYCSPPLSRNPELLTSIMKENNAPTSKWSMRVLLSIGAPKDVLGKALDVRFSPFGHFLTFVLSQHLLRGLEGTQNAAASLAAIGEMCLKNGALVVERGSSVVQKAVELLTTVSPQRHLIFF